MVSDVVNDAKKVAYLVGLYPKKNLQDILATLFMPPIAKDCAVWEAEKRGWVKISKKKRDVSLTDEEAPLPMLDDSISAITDRVKYALAHENAREEDIDEVMFLTWMAGYATHDILIALNLLMDDGVITSYTISEGKKHENVYTFWTLAENESHEWGKKRFPDKSNLLVAAKNNLDL